MKRMPSNALVWFGVLGGPCAWFIQFLVNLWFGYAECGAPGRWELPVKGWEIGTTVVAIAIGLVSITVAARIYRQTAKVDEMATIVRRGFGGEPPLGRINFLAVCGLTVNFLAIVIVIMTGVGVPILTVCRQS